MLHDQIVRLSVAQDRCQICKPLLTEMLIHSVHDSDLFIHDDIGIVCHSERYYVLSLEQIDLVIVNSDVFDIICYLHIMLL